MIRVKVGSGLTRSFRPLAAVCPRRDLPVPMKSVAGRYITSEPVLAPRVLVPAMSFTSTNNPSSIFENGKLKSGIYKIQNLHNDAYVDIHEHSERGLYCRSAQDLREGRGLVRPYPLSEAHV